jgi:hypothetical protein
MRGKLSNKKRAHSGKSGTSQGWFVGVSGWGPELNSVPTLIREGNQPRKELQMAPDTKFLVTNPSITAANFLSNTWYTYNCLSGIAQGTADGNRIGDFIRLKAISISFTTDSSMAAVATSPFMIRVLLVASTVQSAVVNFTAGLTAAQIAFGGGTSVAAIPDSKRVKVLKDEVYTFLGNGAGACTGTGGFQCVLNKPFEFQTGLTYGTASNLYLLLMGDAVAAGTVSTFNPWITVAYSDE